MVFAVEMRPKHFRSDRSLWTHQKPCSKILRIDVVRDIYIENSSLYVKRKIPESSFGMKNLNTEKFQFSEKKFFFEDVTA